MAYIIGAMCGRFVMFTVEEDLFETVSSLPAVEEVRAPYGTPPKRYNLAPTNQVALIRLDGSEALVEPARWGLIPHWAKDDFSATLFNARSETVREKPSFRFAYKNARGLIVLDGYYEWLTRGDGSKQPYYVYPEHGMLFAAALFSHGQDQLSCTMLTTETAEPMEWLHHRLPLFLAAEDVRTWCEGTPEEAAELLRPASEKVRDTLRWHAVDPAVGDVRNDGPELIDDTSHAAR